MEHRKQDRWDHLLDVALNEYGKAEPRPGLEGRVMANLLAEKNRVGSRRGYWGMVGAAIATAGIALTFWLENTDHKARGIASADLNPTTRDSGKRMVPPQGQANPLVHGVKSEAPRRTKPRPTRDLLQTQVQKLEQFPSPHPLSEQEKLLLIYMKQTPEQEIATTAIRSRDLQDLQITGLEIAPLVPGSE